MKFEKKTKNPLTWEIYTRRGFFENFAIFSTGLLHHSATQCQRQLLGPTSLDFQQLSEHELCYLNRDRNSFLFLKKSTSIDTSQRTPVEEKRHQS